MPTSISGAVAGDGLKISSLGDCAKKYQQARRRRGEGKRRGRWGVPARGGAIGGEGEAEAALAGPIYRPAMSVLAARYFSPAELTQWRAHVPNPLGWFTTVWACPHVWLRELGLAHGGTVG